MKFNLQVKAFVAFAVMMATGVPQYAGASEVKFCYGNYKGVTRDFGTQRADNYDVAIHVKNPSIVGSKVKRVRVPMDASVNAEDISVWLSSELKVEKKVNVPDIASVSASVSNGWIDVEFPEPYQITDNGVYVGYSFKVPEIASEVAKNPIKVYSNNDDPEGLYIHTSKKYLSWKSHSADAMSVSAIEVILDGDFHNGDASITALSSQDVDKEDESFQFPVTFTSFGSKPIESLDFVYSFNGGAEEHEIITYDPAYDAQFGVSSTINVKLKNNGVTGNNVLKLRLDAINGEKNLNKDNAVESRIYVFDLLPVKRPLFEEYTGLWCGFCVRGYAALEYMRAKYPDDFIGVSIHGDDEMQTLKNDQMPGRVPGYPGSWTDRTYSCDPYFGRANMGNFGTERDWLAQREVFCPVKLDVDASVDDENPRLIRATATAAFIRSLTHDARILFYLIGDGLSNPRWNQHNYYTSKDAPMQLHEMDQFTQDGKANVRGLVFNDILVMASDTKGIEGSLPPYAEVVAEQPYSYDFSFDLDKAYSLRNHDLSHAPSYRVVAAVVDTETGQILNAARCDVSGYSAVGSVEADAKPVKTEYYDMTGNRVCRPSGIVIKVTRYSDGTVRSSKVVAETEF